MAEKSPTRSSMDLSERARLSLGRKLVYTAILTGTFFLLLVGSLELALRVTGYGHSPHFTRREKLPDGSVVWRENRDFTAPFFSEQLVRRPQPFRLPDRKTPGTIRIFVLGSSAAMGDPEASFSLARLLEIQLRAAYPDNTFEIVNAAVTAINSHLVRGIAEDCAQLEPDLFIVYEGHNEVIGPFGPTGVFTAFLRSESAVRAAIWLKSTRTGQLLASLARHGGITPEKWGGMEMFLQHQIAADDPRLDAVRAHFRANLRAIVRSAERAGAATLLCTTLANQRDFAPFLSLHRRALTDAQLSEWNILYRTGNDAALAGDLSRAQAAYRAALEIDPAYAELSFRLARLNLAAGEHDRTRALFQRALDLDALRFRADSSFNAIVRDLPSSLPGKNVRAIDLEAALAASSTSGFFASAGNKLLYEHVHLTFLGADSVARELLPVIASELHTRGLVSATHPRFLDTGETRRRLAFTAYEQAMIFLELQNRFQRPPFTLQSDHAIRLETTARQLSAAQTLLARPDATASLRAAYDYAIAHAPSDWILQRNAGMMLLARGEPAAALPLLEKAAAWIDDDIDTVIALTRCYRALDRPTDADRLLARARRLEPLHPELASSAGLP